MSYRELAIVTWVVILILWVFIDRYQKDERRSIIMFIRSICNILLHGSAFRFLELYEFVFVIILVKVFMVLDQSMWMFKDYFTSLFVSVGPVLAKSYNHDFSRDLKKTFMELFLWSGISEFIISQYTFSFMVEFFVIVPGSIFMIFFAEMAKNSDDKNGEVISHFVYSALGILVVGVLVRDVVELFHNYRDFESIDFWLSYFMPVIVFLIHIPFLFMWSWISMIDPQMQYFKKSSTRYYVIYLVEAFLQRLRYSKCIKNINWSSVEIAKESAIADRGYKVNFLDCESVGKIKLVMLAIQYMAVPKENYGDVDRYFPVKIDAFMQNFKVATWQEEKLEEDYRWVENNYDDIGKGVSINSQYFTDGLS